MLMLEYYVSIPSRRRRLADGPFSSVLEAVAMWIHENGYSRATGLDWFCDMGHFGQWYKAKGLDNDSLERCHVNQYVMECPRRRRNVSGRMYSRNAQKSMFPVALRLLEEKRFGHTGTSITAVPSPLDEFRMHLRDQCALSHSCTNNYMRWARSLHQFAFHSPNAPWKSLNASMVLTFVDHVVRRCKLRCRRMLLTALRAYFHYLQLCGQCVQHLLDALPRIKRLPRQLPERVLTVEQQRLWLNGIDRSIAEGRRDYAMALCLCDLGLRVGDLATLTLDDFDWRKGAIRIPNGKCKRRYWLPLPYRVGRAIAAYVRRDRPTTKRREVFVRHRSPHTLPLAANAIQRRLQTVAREQGIPEPLTGTRAMRQTFATRLYEQGTPLKEVADMLGHEDIESTTIYAKISRRELSQVALPWPEEQS
jgi:integrase/recombinase XerD